MDKKTRRGGSIHGTVTSSTAFNHIYNAIFSILNNYSQLNYWHLNRCFNGVKMHICFVEQLGNTDMDYVVQIRMKYRGTSYTYRDKVTLEKESDILDPTIISPIVENILKDLENNDFSNFEVV